MAETIPTRDEEFMAHALQLSLLGRGNVEPNPMVGAVIVQNDYVIAEGYHRKFGGLHAEREALQAAAMSGCDVTGATMYVTLEPCSHHGKTPPCTDAIIAAKLGRVVVAMIDPDSQVAGRGVDILRAAGITVDTGIGEPAVRGVLAPYIKHRTTGRPWVIAKWAQTSDGYLALPPEEGRWITGDVARRRVHEIRGQLDAIAVGIGTVLADDPQLTNRSGEGKQPVRLVLDTHLRCPAVCKLTESVYESPVVVATSQQAIDAAPDHAHALRDAGLELLALPLDSDGHVSIGALLDEAGRRGWTYLQFEGGATLLRSLLLGDWVDEIQAYVSPLPLGYVENLPRLPINEVLDFHPYQLVASELLAADELQVYRRNKNE